MQTAASLPLFSMQADLAVVKGRHADRLFTVCYLPVQLLILLIMIVYDLHLPLRPRITLGFATFVLVMPAVVPLVSRAPKHCGCCVAAACR